MPDYRSVRTDDGRELDVLLTGARDGRTVVYHGGTPSGSVPFPNRDDAAADRGLRVVTYDRPGYGGSTPQPGRTVADAARDTATILDALDVESFLTVGWSGGGPHALACAALLPDRCQAAATMSSVAPYQVEGLVWVDGMGPENVEEFAASAAGPEALTAYLAGADEPRTAETIADALGGLVSDVDLAAITGPVAEYIADAFNRATVNGVAGWRDDDLAFMAAWGFDVASIDTPLSLWHGEQDLMVPYAHGRWLADHAPGARHHLLSNEGHVSFWLRFGDVLDDLVDLVP